MIFHTACFIDFAKPNLFNSILSFQHYIYHSNQLSSDEIVTSTGTERKRKLPEDIDAASSCEKKAKQSADDVIFV